MIFEKKWHKNNKIYHVKLMLVQYGLKYLKKINQVELNKDNWFLISIWMIMMMWEIVVKGKKYVYYVGNY